jgi:hypothetical protein
LFYCY